MTGRKKNQIFGKYGIVPPLVYEKGQRTYCTRDVKVHFRSLKSYGELLYLRPSSFSVRCGQFRSFQGRE